jgi:hypothetical protein
MTLDSCLLAKNAKVKEKDPNRKQKSAFKIIGPSFIPYHKEGYTDTFPKAFPLNTN